jgi:hypothetical protein
MLAIGLVPLAVAARLLGKFSFLGWQSPFDID